MNHELVFVVALPRVERNFEDTFCERLVMKGHTEKLVPNVLAGHRFFLQVFKEMSSFQLFIDNNNRRKHKTLHSACAWVVRKFLLLLETAAAVRLLFLVSLLFEQQQHVNESN